ncbi:hypothetical protein Hanom_Chr10g00908191 [Helianthus anomalus]
MTFIPFTKQQVLTYVSFWTELACFKNVRDGNGTNLKFGLNWHNWTNHRDENGS